MTRMASHYALDIPFSVIPVLSAGVLLFGTYWEVTQLCDSFKELEDFHEDMEIDDSFGNELLGSLCSTIQI
jgi:hypothetical protein